MKYFEVHKEELVGTVVSGEIFADGEWVNLPDDMEQHSLTTGFSVYEYDENGVREDTTFYPVTTDTETWEDNSEEQIENIKRDYPPDLWQNNSW